MSPRILITGGSGFIASYVAQECVNQNCKVLLQSRTCNISDSLLQNQAVSLLNCSFLALKPESLSDVACIIHLASAGVSPRNSGWCELEQINIKGTLAMCQLALKLNARLVVAGSFAEYGNSGLRYTEIPVAAPLEPTFPYAISKASACQIALGFARSESLSLAYLRIFNAFGIGQHESNLWPSLVAAAQSGSNYQITPGEQVRDFIPVRDVARQFVNAATDLQLRPGSPFVANVASGKPVRLRDFCEYWWKHFEAKGDLLVGAIPYRNNEVMRYVPCLEPAFL